jgi:hypothetical protein
MKRFSPILFIWIFCLIGTLLISCLSYIENGFFDSLGWLTASTFLINLILYHFYTTRDQKSTNDLLDD